MLRSRGAQRVEGLSYWSADFSGADPVPRFARNRCQWTQVVQSFHSLALTNSIEVFGAEGLILPVGVFLIAVFLTWFAKLSEKRGWIR